MLLAHHFLQDFLTADRAPSKQCGHILACDVNQKITVKLEATRKSYLTSFFLSIIFVTHAAYLMFSEGGHHSTSLAQAIVEKSQGIMLLSVFHVPIAGCFQRGRNPWTLTWLLNGLISVEKHLIQGSPPELSSKAKVGRWLCRITGAVAQTIAPVVLGLAVGIQPQLPLNPIYPLIIIFETGLNSFNGIVRITCAFVGAFVWHTVGTCGYRLVVDIIAVPISVNGYQNVVKTNLLRICKVQRRDTLEGAMYSQVNLLRTIPLLVDCYNKWISSNLVYLLFAVGVTEVVSAVLLSRAADIQLGVPLCAFFVVVVIQAFITIMGVYSFPAGVFLNSRATLSDLKSDGKLVGNATFRRILKSVRPSKIKFGGSNFIEESTPLVFQSFCIARIIDLLLLSKKSHG